MAIVLNIWESDISNLPVDPNERMALWDKQIEATKQMLEAVEQSISILSC